MTSNDDFYEDRTFVNYNDDSSRPIVERVGPPYVLFHDETLIDFIYQTWNQLNLL